MTVKELKQLLENYNENLHVKIQQTNIVYYNDYFCSPPFDAITEIEKIVYETPEIIMLSGENCD